MSNLKRRLTRWFWLSLGWVGGLILLLLAASLVIEAPLGSLILVGMAALIIPLVRDRYPFLALSGQPLAVTLFVSFTIFGFAVVWHEGRRQDRQERAAERAEQLRQEQERAAERAEQVRDSLRSLLSTSRDSILGVLRGSLDGGDPEAALEGVEPYLFTGDDEVLAIRDKAKQKAREQELREIVASVPASDYTRNRDLYSELTDLRPDNPRYQERLDRYTRLAEEEAQRERAEAERKREEARQAAAERERRRSTTAMPDGTRVLKVSARFTGTQIHVTNESGERWSNCELEVNAGIIRGGWATGPVNIGAGQTVKGGVLTFTKSDGERFNPATHQVETLTVTCDTPEGRHLWIGEFR